MLSFFFAKRSYRLNLAVCILRHRRQQLKKNLFQELSPHILDQSVFLYVFVMESYIASHHHSLLYINNVTTALNTHTISLYYVCHSNQLLHEYNLYVCCGTRGVKLKCTMAGYHLGFEPFTSLSRPFKYYITHYPFSTNAENCC